MKASVKFKGSQSEYFDILVGLKQGDNLSPILFSIFLEDLELSLQNKVDSGLTLRDITLILPLFADDMVVLGSSPEDIKNFLDNLYNFCNTWSLTVNTDKTKIVAFRKRGKLTANEHWFYNGQVIEAVLV